MLNVIVLYWFLWHRTRMKKVELQNMYTLYMYSFLYYSSHYQDQVGWSRSGWYLDNFNRTSIPYSIYLGFDLGDKLNLILLLL